MIFRNHHIDNDPALDADDDRDLIVLANEARDPQQLARVTKMARQRRRQRARQAGAEAQSARSSRSRGARLAVGRALSFRA